MRILKILSIFVFASLLSTESNAFNIYRVDNVVVGKTYNELLDRWLENDFSIWVGVSERGNEVLLFKGEAGFGDATVTARYTADLQGHLEEAVSKAIKWSAIARDNKADTSRGLGCFGGASDDICRKRGNAYDENQLGMSFFANNGGKQTDLILDLIDRDNQFIKTDIYLNTEKMKQLLEVVRHIPGRFKKARETAKKQDLFK